MHTRRRLRRGCMHVTRGSCGKRLEARASSTDGRRTCKSWVVKAFFSLDSETNGLLLLCAFVCWVDEWTFRNVTDSPQSTSLNGSCRVFSRPLTQAWIGMDCFDGFYWIRSRGVGTIVEKRSIPRFFFFRATHLKVIILFLIWWLRFCNWLHLFLNEIWYFSTNFDLIFFLKDESTPYIYFYLSFQLTLKKFIYFLLQLSSILQRWFERSRWNREKRLKTERRGIYHFF